MTPELAKRLREVADRWCDEAEVIADGAKDDGAMYAVAALSECARELRGIVVEAMRLGREGRAA